MQYGIDVFPYERVSESREKKDTKKTLNYNCVVTASMSFVIAFLISRVTIINSTAPFGITLLIVLLFHVKDIKFLFPCAGSVLGYISIYNNVDELGRYLLAIAIIAVISYTMKKVHKVKKIIFSLTLIMISFIMYKLFVIQKGFSISILSSVSEMVCIFPLYFIIDYSIVCFKDINTKHLFNSEELITMAIFISLVIAGTTGMKIYNISITNILTLVSVLVLSYVCGSSVGAAGGVAIGAVIGMSTNNIIVFTSIYGLCGLIAGVFKEIGKWVTAISCLVIFFIIAIYSKNMFGFKLIEPIIASIIFLGIPNKYYKKLAIELNREDKEKYINSEYVDKVKDMLVKRVDSFSEVLNNMSETLVNLCKNDKLSMKSKSTSLVENLADRVCSNCNMKGMCWKRELHYTYTAFEELIQNYQQGKKNIPREIGRKCINKEALINNTEDIVNGYVINELLNRRLHEGRDILAQQISNMAGSLKEITNEFGYGVKFNVPLEKDISRVLNKEDIKHKDVTCFNDKNGKNIIKLKLNSCGGKQTCVKEILPLINEVTGCNMCIEEEGCCIDPKTEECIITFNNSPKYHVASYIQRKAKDGEEYNGDSYSFGRVSNGNYLIVLSDGMGSGPEASEESGAVVELIEKFISSGFNESTAINAVNSIMSLKFCEEEKFSTVDLGNIDLYTGDMEFVKVGATASFIKRGDFVQSIKSKTLPIGILDKVDADTFNYKLENGDMVIMLSDGVIDYNNDNVGKCDWVEEYLENTTNNNPKEIAEDLINKSIKLSNGKVRDDMTIIVSKVYNLY